MSRTITNVTKLTSTDLIELVAPHGLILPTSTLLSQFKRKSNTGITLSTTGELSLDGEPITLGGEPLGFFGSATPLVLEIEGDIVNDWISGKTISIYAAENLNIWASGSIVTYNHPTLTLSINSWSGDDTEYDDWVVESLIKLGSTFYNEETQSIDFVVESIDSPQFRTYDNKPATIVSIAKTEDIAYVRKDGDTMTGDLIMQDSAAILLSDGIETIPALSFESDTNTGVYYHVDTTPHLGISVSGQNIIDVSVEYVNVNSSISLIAGLQSRPAISFQQSDTGFYLSNEDEITIVTNGFDSISINEEFTTINTNLEITGLSTTLETSNLELLAKDKTTNVVSSIDIIDLISDDFTISKEIISDGSNTFDLTFAPEYKAQVTITIGGSIQSNKSYSIVDNFITFTENIDIDELITIKGTLSTYPNWLLMWNYKPFNLYFDHTRNYFWDDRIMDDTAITDNDSAVYSLNTHKAQSMGIAGFTQLNINSFTNNSIVLALLGSNNASDFIIRRDDINSITGDITIAFAISDGFTRFKVFSEFLPNQLLLGNTPLTLGSEIILLGSAVPLPDFTGTGNIDFLNKIAIGGDGINTMNSTDLDIIKFGAVYGIWDDDTFDDLCDLLQDLSVQPPVLIGE